LAPPIYAEFSLSNDVDFYFGDFFSASDVSDNMIVLTCSKLFSPEKYNMRALEIQSS
jgi:hypothetical protein